MDKKGTITIQWKYKERVVPDGALRAYRVGDIDLNGTTGDYTFQPVTGLTGVTLAKDDLTAETAKKLAGKVSGAGITGKEPASSDEGVIKFTELELGLYLIVQTRSIHGYETITPFLVSVPMWEDGTEGQDDGRYKYEIEVVEKFEMKRVFYYAPQPTPDGDGTTGGADTTGKLPQTGQLNWPVPVLLLLGGACIVTGVGLRRRPGHA